MSLNNTPSAERIHIGIFGRTNAGKSSLINAMTGQSLAIVSDVKGTTTDPVLKAMELLPLGPVVMIDTPGLDDDSELGSLRIQKAYQMLNKTDIAILAIDSQTGLTAKDTALLSRIMDKKIPYLIVRTKSDLSCENQIPLPEEVKEDSLISVSTKDEKSIHILKERIAHLVPETDSTRKLVADLVKPMDFVILVVPIDSSAPKGRLILPQQQTIRDLLEAGAVSIVVKDTELADTLSKLERKPDLIITDSQAFARVSKDTPEDIPLTSFSILFARYKGNLRTVVKGAYALDTLENGDTVLISEGCTHHRQCEDIGTVKLPKLLKKYTGKELNLEFSSGTEFPTDLSQYKLIIHCGACTLNEREMKYRLKCAEDAGVPMTNYGTSIAYMNGILKRSIAIFEDELK